MIKKAFKEFLSRVPLNIGLSAINAAVLIEFGYWENVETLITIWSQYLIALLVGV